MSTNALDKVTIESVQHTQEISHRVGISGAEPVQQYQTTQPFTPQWMTVVYMKRHGAKWEIERIVLAGPRVLKSGKPGENRSARYYHGKDAPDWAREYAEIHIPGGR